MANLSADRRHKAPLPDTHAKIQLIIDDIGLGVPYQIACESHGLSEKHLYNWIWQGRADLEANKETPQSKMVQSLKCLENAVIKSCLSDIRASEKSHKGAEWTLERRFWKHFSNQVGLVDLQGQMDELRVQQGAKNDEKRDSNES